MEIELEANVKRWDFPKMKEIFQKPKHIIAIISEISEVCTICKDFNNILNNELKAVTGSSDQID